VLRSAEVSAHPNKCDIRRYDDHYNVRLLYNMYDSFGKPNRGQADLWCE